MRNRCFLTYVILFSLCILVSGCTEINNKNLLEEITVNPDEETVEELIIDHSAANLTLSLIPSELSLKEISNLQLTLKNEGNYTVNVARLEEFATYNIIYANGSDIFYEHQPSMEPLGDHSLVELKPNESLSINISTRGWGPFSKSVHSLSARYFVIGPNLFTKPHWKGVLRSNNITLRVE